MKILPLVLPALLLAGCQTRAERTEAGERSWLNRSVADYAAAHSLVPTRIGPTSYVLGPPSALSACRRTLLTEPDGQTIREIVWNNC